MIDLSSITDDELSNLFHAVSEEQSRRITLQNVQEAISNLQKDYLVAAGREIGQPWVQPEGAHDVYPIGWVVTHMNKTWTSLTDNNAHAPGVSGWREETPEGSGPAEWVQPSGGHDAYKTGDLVTFQGRVYKSKINANVWSPTGYPQGWELQP